MARIGIYGGTFNPPHIGHISAAAQAVEMLKLDKLLLIPASTPPHKVLPENSPTPEQRLELVQLAARGIDKFEVLDIELRREGRSYTADTVEQLHGIYPRDRLYLLMGTDMMNSFHSWYQPERICRYATLAVLMRERKDIALWQQMQSRAKHIRETFGGRVRLLRNDILPMSSTDVRRMLVFWAAAEMLPEAVLRRVTELGFYGAGRDCRGLPPEELEKTVISLLEPRRIDHVLGCRDTAVSLARKYGADETQAARAGLLHDVTKALPPDLHTMLCRAHGVPPERCSWENDKTMHALTGAVAARQVFGEDEAVCRAIESHTTGCAGMDTLQKIIYIADYIEPNRDFPGVEHLRRLAWEDLDGAVLLGLQMTVDLLRRRGLPIAQRSLEAMQWIKSQLV